MESTNRLRYLIAGTGGVGGSIAGFLSLAGKDVTCIARGAHLQAIQQDGLKLKSDLKGEHALRINACTAEEYNEVCWYFPYLLIFYVLLVRHDIRSQR